MPAKPQLSDQPEDEKIGEHTPVTLSLPVDPAPPTTDEGTDTPPVVTEGDASVPADPPSDVESASPSGVQPGDHDGLAGIVLWSLGLGDSIPTYNDAAVALVKRKQADAGLEPTGVVDDETWSLILPTFGAPGAPAFGPHVAWVRNLLGIEVTTRWTDECSVRVAELQIGYGLEPTGVLDFTTRCHLLKVV